MAILHRIAARLSVTAATTEVQEAYALLRKMGVRYYSKPAQITKSLESDERCYVNIGKIKWNGPGKSDYKDDYLFIEFTIQEEPFDISKSDLADLGIDIKHAYDVLVKAGFKPKKSLRLALY